MLGSQKVQVYSILPGQGNLRSEKEYVDILIGNLIFRSELW